MTQSFGVPLIFRIAIIYIIYMLLSPKISVNHSVRSSRAALLFSIAALACFACAPRASYHVSTLYFDDFLSARALGSAEVAVLPVISSTGALTEGVLAADAMVKRFKPRRPDLVFVPYDAFENGFPPRHRNNVADLYKRIYNSEILAIKAMDTLWASVRQEYILAFTLRDGAVIHNLDGSVFSHVSVMAELWNSGGREVVWRAQCRGVSDDRAMTDSELIAETMRSLVEAIPATAPNYGREQW